MVGFIFFFLHKTVSWDDAAEGHDMPAMKEEEQIILTCIMELFKSEKDKVKRGLT